MEDNIKNTENSSEENAAELMEQLLSETVGSPTFMFRELMSMGEKFPKSIKLYKQFVLGDKQSHLSDMIPDNEMLFTLVFQPRVMYDFFDTQGVIVVIDHIKSWDYIINSIPSGETFNSRIEAEKAAFIKAFEELERR